MLASPGEEQRAPVQAGHCRVTITVKRRKDQVVPSDFPAGVGIIATRDRKPPLT